jgi:hypothetical protein
MKRKIIGIFVCTLLLVTAIVPLTIALDEENDKITKTTSKGGARKGIIVVDHTEVEGAPDEFYVGSLKDVDFQLNNVALFVVMPIPFFILSTVLETTDNIHLQIDYFWGVTDPTFENYTMIVGYFRNAEWEW